jgi:hypothetical protein
VSPSADLSLCRSVSTRVFIEHAKGRAPAKLMAPSGATQVKGGYQSLEAGFQPYQARSDDEEGVWLLRVIDCDTRRMLTRWPMSWSCQGKGSSRHGRRKEG